VLSGLLGFWQEHRAGLAVRRLLALVQVHADVRRDGAVVEVAPAEVVPGDVVVLGAGDIIPCDCRLLRADDLQVDDAALTGETFPRHKHPDPAAADAPLAERHSALLGVAAVTISLPYLAWLAEPLALVPLPATVLAALAAITLAYVAAAEAGKRLFYQAIDRPAPQPPAGRHPRRLLRAVREHGGTPVLR
jgi:P-type E1-E2 ATPase